MTIATKPNLTQTQLFAQMDELIRTMPARDVFKHPSPENIAWRGRALALMKIWDPIEAISFGTAIDNLEMPMASFSSAAANKIITMLHQAYSELQLSAVGPLTVAVQKGKQFDYFNEVRKLFESAKTELFIVDPYLDANFVEMYLPYVAPGIKVRLLGKEYINKLIPALKSFQAQQPLNVEVRKAKTLHDRFVFVDQVRGYMTGASFKDGPKNDGTSITQLVDVFATILNERETTWKSSTFHPL